MNEVGRIVLFLAALSLGSITPAFADVFVKNQNNGTVSCDTYCAGPWGERYGTCVSAVREDTQATVDCSVATGLLPGPQLTCTCRGLVKAANNGTVSCQDWCSRSNPAPATSCVAGRRGDTGERLGCEAVPGLMANGLTYECHCTVPSADIPALQSQRDQLQHQKIAIADALAREQAAQNAASTQRGQEEARLAAVQFAAHNTQRTLTDHQANLDAAIANEASQAKALAVAHAEKANQEAEAKNSAAEEAAAAARLQTLHSEKERLAAELAKLKSLGQEHSAQLNARMAEASSIRSQLESANAIAAKTPLNIQRLVAQTGTISGEKRNCSAFEISSREVRTAWHCVADLSPEALVRSTFTAANKITYVIAGIVRKDERHDAVVLSLNRADNAFVNFSSVPKVGRPTYLLALDKKVGSIALTSACQILSVDLETGLIRHNCSSASGSSGGALIQDGLIVGVHIGRLRSEKLATFVHTADKRGMDASTAAGMIQEYNCDSNCHRDATRTILGRKIFDPTKFSLCEAARVSDCAARAAGAAAARLADAAAAETDRLSGLLERETSELANVVRTMEMELSHASSATRVIEGGVTQIKNQIAQAQAVITNFETQIVIMATQITDKTAHAVELARVTDLAKQATRGLIETRKTTVARTKDLTEQAEVIVTHVREITQEIESVTKDVALSSAKLVDITKAISMDTQDLSVANAISQLAKIIPPVVPEPVRIEDTSLQRELDLASSRITEFRKNILDRIPIELPRDGVMSQDLSEAFDKKLSLSFAEARRAAQDALDDVERAARIAGHDISKELKAARDELDEALNNAGEDIVDAAKQFGKVVSEETKKCLRGRGICTIQLGDSDHCYRPSSLEERAKCKREIRNELVKKRTQLQSELRVKVESKLMPLTTRLSTSRKAVDSLVQGGEVSQ